MRAVRVGTALLLLWAAAAVPGTGRAHAWQSSAAEQRSREAKERLRADHKARLEAILAAVREGRGDDAVGLFAEHLRVDAERIDRTEGRAGSDYDESRFVDSIVGLSRPSDGGDAEAPQQAARVLLRRILVERPELFSRSSWRDLQRTPRADGVPRFVLPQSCCCRFAPEVTLIAENDVGTPVECRLYKLRDVRAVKRSSSGGRGTPDTPCGPHRLTENDLIDLDRTFVWAKQQVKVRFDEPGAYVILQEQEGIRYFQPIDVPSYRIDIRPAMRPGVPLVVMAVDVATGRGVGGVTVALFDDPGFGKPLEAAPMPLGVTDERGLLSVPSTLFEGLDRPVIESRRGSETWFDDVGDSPTHESYSFAPDRRASTLAAERPDEDPLDRQPFLLVGSERPRYRPGETVRYRAVVRDGGGGMMAPSQRPVRVEIRDRPGRLVHGAAVTWGPFGSLGGTWTIPDDAAPGDYTITVTGPRLPIGLGVDPLRSSGRFEVSDARVPDFGVRVVPGAEPDSAEIRAAYLTGGPVADADVQWRVVAVKSWTRPHYSFEQLIPLDDPRAWLCHAQVEGTRLQRKSDDVWNDFAKEAVPEDEAPIIVSGQGRTGPDGALRIRWPKLHPRAEDEELVGPWRARVIATVRDLSRLPVEIRADIDPAIGPLRLEVGTDQLFSIAEEPLEVRIRASRPDGEPVADLEVALEGLLQDRRAEGDTPGHREFFRGTLRTDARGRARQTLRVPGGGRVRWKASAHLPGAAGGEVVIARADHWSADGDGTIENWLGREGELFGREHEIVSDAEEASETTKNPTAPTLATDDDRGAVIRITPDRFAYAAGETIRVLVRGASRLRHLVVGIETRTSVRVETFDLHGGTPVIELPVTDADRGLATIWVHGFAGLERDIDARTVAIHPRRKLLDVAVRSRSRDVLPGSKVPVDVRVLGSDGSGRHAEVEVALIDEADIVAGRSLPDHPLVRLDPFQAMGDYVQRDHCWNTFPPEPSLPDRFAAQSFSGEGVFLEEIDGATSAGWRGPPMLIQEPGAEFPAGPDPDAMPPPDGATAAGCVVTDAEGRATVEIDVPDRPTAWRVVARAVTRGGGAGMGATTIVSRRSLAVSLVAPRVLHEGDQSTVTAIVANGQGMPVDVTVHLRADGQPLGERSLRLEPGARRRVDWDLAAGAVGTRRLEAEAVSAAASHRAEVVVPVEPTTTACRFIVTTRMGGDDRAIESSFELPQGFDPEAEVRVKIEATPLLEAPTQLDKLARELPHRTEDFHAEALSDAIAAFNAVRATGIGGRELERFVSTRLEILLRNAAWRQRPDGSWEDRTQDVQANHVTAMVYRELAAARAAGFAVDDVVEGDARAFLVGVPPDPFILAILAQAGERPAAESLERMPLDALFEALIAEGTDLPSFPMRSVPTPRQVLAAVVAAGRGDLLSELPVVPPGEGAARTVRSAREAADVIQAIARRDPRSDLLSPLVSWLRDPRAWDHADGTAVAKVLAVIPPDTRPRRGSVEINGEPVIVPGADSETGRTKSLAAGENRIVFRPDGETDYDVTITLGCRGTGPIWSLQRDRPFERRLERFRGTEPDGRPTWEIVPSGGTVSVRDRLRVVVSAPRESEPVRAPLFDVPLGAGLETTRSWGGLGHVGFSEPLASWEARPDLVRADVAGAWSPSSDDDRSELPIEIRATSPGRYRLPPAVARRPIGRDWRTERSDGFCVDELTESFDLIVEE